MENKIVIVVPYIRNDEDFIEQQRKLLIKRAGVEVSVYPIKDTQGLGWIGIHNNMAKELDYDWYVYCADDYFPGRDYITKALETAHKTKKRLIGFNDGKWDGKNATAGMIHKSLIPLMYGGPLLWPGYIHHGSDPDLTEKAIIMNEYAYSPEAILIEIDYNKDFIPSNKRLNKKDVELFLQRRELRFPGV